MTARLPARGRPGPRFFGGLGRCFLMRRHKGRGTRKSVDILGLLFILTFQDAPRWTFVFGQTNCPRGAYFVSQFIFRIGSKLICGTKQLQALSYSSQPSTQSEPLFIPKKEAFW